MQTLQFEVFGANVVFGWKELEKLGEHVGSFGKHKALIVSDKGVTALRIPERVSTILKKAGIDSVPFSDVAENPTDVNVLDGTKLYESEACDMIIGVGGGSPMDAAKGIQVSVSHPAPLSTYYGVEGIARIVNPMPPLVEIPTTSGTGSETSKGAVITDTAQNVKRLVRPGMPALALVDPELTVGMPPALTAATGMDAMSHHVEAFLSRQYQPVAEAIALEGIRLVAEFLVTAVEDGQNREARSQMAMASSLGSIAFQKGLGVTHSLAHQLSTEYGIHHGVANAVLLPYTMAFNRDAVERKMVRIAFAMGAESLTSEGAILAMTDLIERVNLPLNLSDLGVREDAVPVMAQNAMGDWCYPNNPKSCTKEDMEMLFHKAMKG